MTRVFPDHGVIDIETSQLKVAVESQLGGFAILSQSVPVRETLNDKTAWEGVVHICKLVGHPKADQAYAWSAIEDGKRRFFAVLHAPPITSPAAAARATIEQEYRSQK